jgi:hypothetical protein
MFLLLHSRKLISLGVCIFILMVSIKMSDSKFIEINGYRLSKNIISPFLQLIVWGCIIGVIYCLGKGIPLSSFECVMGPFEHPDYCDNPYFIPPTWQNMEKIPIGKYGSIPFLAKYAAAIVILLLLLAFALNHLIHNRGYKFENIKIDS